MTSCVLPLLSRAIWSDHCIIIWIGFKRISYRIWIVVETVSETDPWSNTNRYVFLFLSSQRAFCCGNVGGIFIYTDGLTLHLARIWLTADVHKAGSQHARGSFLWQASIGNSLCLISLHGSLVSSHATSTNMGSRTFRSVQILPEAIEDIRVRTELWIKWPQFVDMCLCRANSRFAPSQWETSLQCNAVSHWLSPAYAFSSKKCVEFRLRFHWSLCSWGPTMQAIRRHWRRRIHAPPKIETL